MLGEPWQSKFATDTGLLPSDERELMDAIGLESQPPASHSPAAYESFLRQFGPVWVTTGDLYVHARLLVGIEGDGSAQGTRLTLIDPTPDGQ